MLSFLILLIKVLTLSYAVTLAFAFFSKYFASVELVVITSLSYKDLTELTTISVLFLCIKTTYCSSYGEIVVTYLPLNPE